ncbi:MAG: 2-oxoglutarate dehydrogenase, E2 component, dihydrolipoamide succinyltransferase [Ignavibacteriales bacterium]|jgi:2-oxoglutarate dehydrogenase E2 component (dihydrolipoamide succinyltransferase)|nr:2-oxoglutarate dehydrogenase, E2 component, dihydrolipoamide succinyltransferase [Ignavibacteriaceae bacterium]NLH62067.1 2-oxoglutarate dehydrogenase, E2 component, dihydrolipoamide succinyltransferase [Ignavibacteriales bacterium]HOJ17711.1 2-oxoglutarate dehydrogenase, E2 component, dihydrolipoamide succinyltransferase [Ignavibacteriaceae bacterium]HPO55629.1 2-oxoglutarate dehydrogenase, E2 component, dihydrolipoamide succinyltransferase [Ignavibacteriaceae bacterium]
MFVEVPMPKMGESIMEGTVIKWYKNVGDFVKKDETLFEISTDKVDTEVPSLAEGVLTKIFVNVNETIEVGKIVAIIDTSNSQDSHVSETSADVVLANTAIASNIQSDINPSSTSITEVVMPKMGESIMEGTVIKWYKKVGDIVKAEETLFEISTDKVDTEVPAPVAGTLIEVFVKEQETVSIGTIVAKISSGDGQVQLTTPKQESIEEVSMHDVVARNTMSGSVPDKPKIESKSSDKSSRFFSPLVMSIANAERIPVEELENIKGTGIGGRITKQDILKYIEVRSLSPKTHHTKKSIPVSPSVNYETPAGKIERIPMDNIRSKIMQHMVNSRDTSVHVTGVVEVDVTKVHNFIKINKEKYLRDEGIKLTYLPFIAMGVVKALKDYPLVNATIEETSIVVKKFINLGIAVAVEPNGLIVPNIKAADEKNLIGLTKSIKDLADRARTKKLTVDEITGGTFTITNYGVFGSLFGTPIINQPEVAILGVGAVVKKPVVLEIEGVESITIKPMMYLSLSHDHRLVDGMLGGRFLTSVKEFIENFYE